MSPLGSWFVFCFVRVKRFKKPGWRRRHIFLCDLLQQVVKVSPFSIASICLYELWGVTTIPSFGVIWPSFLEFGTALSHPACRGASVRRHHAPPHNPYVWGTDRHAPAWRLLELEGQPRYCATEIDVFVLCARINLGCLPMCVLLYYFCLCLWTHNGWWCLNQKFLIIRENA